MEPGDRRSPDGAAGRAGLSPGPAPGLCTLLLLCVVTFPSAAAGQPVGPEARPLPHGVPASAGSPGSTGWNPAPDSLPERIIPGGNLAPGFAPSLSPDGHTLFYVVRRRPEAILISRLENGVWTSPVLAPFSGEWPDQEPFVSPDGKRVFFASRRPVEERGLENPEFDIWVVDWEGGDAFGEPRRLGEEVNTPGYENYPAVTADGSLYFSRRVPGSGTDLFHALPDGDGFHPAQPVQELNSPGSDADPWVDPDGRRMIFSSVRGDGAGQGDLYVSYLCREGWTTPWNLGPRVNTEAYEYTPALSPDGEWLLFSRDRWDVFRIPMALLEVQTPCPPLDGGEELPRDG